MLRLLALLGLSFISTTLTGCQPDAAAEAESVIVQPAPLRSVVALGRLEPEGSLIRVSVSNAQDSRVNQLRVQEGDRVEKNQVIALLQGIERREADVRNAEVEVRLRQAELERVRQGDAKRAQVEAQQAQIEGLQAQILAEQKQRQAAIAASQAVVKDAELTLQRRQSLYQSGGISLADLNQAERDLETAQANHLERQAALQQTVTTLQASIQQAKAELAALKEVRPVDIEIAQANLDRAKIAVEQRRADLEDVRVRAPIAGQILRINTQVGEQVNTAQGIIELARTQQMYAIAEVHESDIGRVRKGQQAILSTDYGGFEGTLAGTVEAVGLQVGRRTLQAETDRQNQDQNVRVVEVKVRLTPEDSAKVAQLTHMLVQISIDTATQSAQSSI